MSTQNIKSRNALLDFMRGLAALEVVAFHLGSFVLPPMGDRSPLWLKIIYHFISHGHDAVMIFFVMSGYLVGGHVCSGIESGKWSWLVYTINRVSRLWVVLIPALLLTLLWDLLGKDVLHGSLYYGLRSGPAFGNSLPVEGGAVHNLGTFLANMFFLQNGIVVGSYGTNGPLWSLANEFWYYVIFPLAYFAWKGEAKILWKIASGVGAFAVCVILPKNITEYGLIWMMGVAVFYLERYEEYLFKRRNIWNIYTILAAIVTIFVMYSGEKYIKADEFYLDVYNGFLFSALLYVSKKITIPKRATRNIFAFSADFSYTLYLTHFPFIAFVLCIINNNTKSIDSIGVLALYFAMMGLSIVYAIGMYFVFERNTGKVQSWLKRLWGTTTAPARVGQS